MDEFPTQNDFVREVVSQNGRLFRVCACSDPSQSLAAFIIMDSKYYRGQVRAACLFHNNEENTTDDSNNNNNNMMMIIQ